MSSRLSVILLVAFFAVAPVRAQVTLQMQQGRVVIANAGYAEQVLAAADGWEVTDAVTGETFATGASIGGAAGRAGAFSTSNETGGRNTSGEETIIIVGGYQDNETGGRNTSGEETIIIVGGYQDMLAYLETTYGAVIEHDPTLGVDLIQLPGVEDPLVTFVEIITQDSLNGHPLIDYLRMMEVVNTGQFGEMLFPALPASQPARFPNDEHFGADWGFAAAGFFEAHWMKAHAQRDVVVSLIDSGIRSEEQSHDGLDGLDVEHVSFAPSVGLQIPHALGLATLLADAGNDGSGSVGLLGAWTDTDCDRQSSYFSGSTPRLISFNVGDWGPSSLYVARAIRASIDAQVDVINLSIRMGYSPTVQDAIRAALDAGIVVVAAGGNYHPDARVKVAGFPANVDGVISVGAAQPDRRRGVDLAPFSANRGIDILAPGTGIVLGGPGGIWYGGEGTSYAAGYVTAAVAMMKAADAHLTPQEVLRALQRGARTRAAGVPFLDAHESLEHVLPRSARGHDKEDKKDKRDDKRDKKEDKRDKKEDKRDKKEDKRDKKEDKRDKKEDKRDEKKDKRDEKKDKRDEKEDKRDEKEDKRDKKEDKRDEKERDQACKVNTRASKNAVMAGMSAGVEGLGQPGDPTAEVPGAFALGQNYPNPFNPTTQIHFDLSSASQVSLKVYDVTGREVRILVDGFRDAGAHTATFDAGDLPSGVYVYRIVAGDAFASRSMVLMK